MYKHPILWATWSWLAVSSTAYLSRLPWIFLGAPLKVSGAPGEIHGKLTALLRQFYAFCIMMLPLTTPGPWFNIKMLSYQYRKSHCGDKMILRPSYLHNGISYTGKTTSLYWIRALIAQALLIDVDIAVAECKTAVSLVHWQWRLCNLVLCHQYEWYFKSASYEWCSR